MENEFLKLEELGKHKLLLLMHLLVPECELEFTLDRYNKIDAIFKYKGKSVGIEIKNRYQKYEFFDTYIMELSKLDYMKELIDNKKVNTCWYINFFENNAYIFKYNTIILMLKNNLIQLEEDLLPNRTVNKTGNTYKLTLLLPKNKALKYTLK